MGEVQQVQVLLLIVEQLLVLVQFQHFQQYVQQVVVELDLMLHQEVHLLVQVEMVDLEVEVVIFKVVVL